jgi:hypothetical protein
MHYQQVRKELSFSPVSASQQFPMRGLDLSRWSNAAVHEAVCELDPA